MSFFIFIMTLLTEFLLEHMENFQRQTKIYKYTFCGPRSLGLLFLFTVIISFGVLYGTWYEEWSFVESLYWTIVTCTTVGYGDYAPSTQKARMIVSFFILIAGGCFAAIIVGVIASYISIRHRAASLLFMMGGLTEEKVAEMPRNEHGDVGRHEFVEYMVVKLGYVAPECLLLIHDCFDAMDIDGNETINANDLISSDEGKQFLEAIRLKHGIRDGDRNLLPFGFFGIRAKFVLDPILTDEEVAAALKKKAQSKATIPEETSDNVAEKAMGLAEGFTPDFLLSKQSFKELDANNDGSLDLEEWIAKFGDSEDSQSAFAKIDKSGDGKISKEEWEAAQKARTTKSPRF